MGEEVRTFRKEAAKRWHEKMPRFFYWLVVVACGVGGTAFAINSGVPALGGTLHEWWTDIYSYIIGVCIGIIFVSKFTVAGGFKEIDPDKVLQGDITFDRDTQQPNMSDVETQQPNN